MCCLWFFIPSSKWRRWRNLHSANSYTHRICIFIIYLRVLNLLNRCFHFRRLAFFCISQKLLSSDLNRCWISISDLWIMGDSFEIYSVISPSRHFVLWVLSIQEMSPNHIVRSFGGCCCCSIYASVVSHCSQLFSLLCCLIRMVLFMMNYVKIINMII